MRAGPGDHKGPCDRKTRGWKDREDRRQGDDPKRQRPGKFVRLDQESRADPPESGEKIAEAHPPAGAEGGPHRADVRPPGRAVLRAVDQPDRDRQRQGDDCEERERRQRQRPGRARDKGDGAPPPAPGQNDALDERGQNVGAGHDGDATLKEPSLVDRRIVIADHSPNRGRVRTRASRGDNRPTLQRISGARLDSPGRAAAGRPIRETGAAVDAAPPAEMSASPRKHRKMKRLAFACFYFLESGLFKDLRPIQIVFFPPPPTARARLSGRLRRSRPAGL